MNPTGVGADLSFWICTVVLGRTLKPSAGSLSSGMTTTSFPALFVTNNVIEYFSGFSGFGGFLSVRQSVQNVNRGFSLVTVIASHGRFKNKNS